MDTVVAQLMGLRPEAVPVLAAAMDRGELTLNSIRTVGDPLDAFILADFDVPEVSVREETSFLVSQFRNRLIPKPVINTERCVRCGMCVQICPVKPKALEQKTSESFPGYIYKNCIRCYCCQEVCPEKAIDIKIPLLGRLLIHRSG
jgi:MinD superfamily P-loop ATPase